MNHKTLYNAELDQMAAGVDELLNEMNGDDPNTPGLITTLLLSGIFSMLIQIAKRLPEPKPD